MSNSIHTLAQHLTGKPDLEACSLEEVQHLAKRYPYFAPAQFLLTQKLKQLNDTGAEKQEQKAILFYHDPLLFNYFISSDNFLADESLLNTNEHTKSVIVGNDEALQNDTEADAITADSILLEENKLHEAEIAESKTDEQVQISTPENVESIIIEDPLPVSSPPDNVHKEAKQEQKIHESTEAISNNAISPVNEELAFEPFHTVDYFASQGIKISQDELPKDRLGKQLKSFTEWLKTMKRLPTAQTAVAVEASTEKKIETMADRSVTESDVVTEAMAEVWAKQGAKEKAEETYNKLSLLNPSKRAYFVAKIENLKES